MQLGFVNFNTEEKKKVAKIVQLLQESEAIEELGSGRVRDYFSNTLFPGTSTLQHHAKYFVLLPSLYYHTAFKSRRFRAISEVEQYIKEAEVQITRQLSANADGTLRTDVTGITGIATYKDALKDYRKYVKYDPAYIYGSGLVRYGIIPDTGIVRLILELNHKHYSDPHTKSIAKNEDLTEDAGDLSGEKQIIRTCGEKYDFFEGKQLDIALTQNEASFLKDRILKTCVGTLLSYLIEYQDIPETCEYYDVEELIGSLNSETRDIYQKSVLFSKLMHIINWRFNYAYYYSFGRYDEAKQCDDEYDSILNQYGDSINNHAAYESLFNHIRPIDMLFTEFCERCYQAIINNDKPCLDDLIKSREHTVKRERSKIGNSAYKDQDRGKPMPNTFRWETVRTMVNEIRKPQ